MNNKTYLKKKRRQVLKALKPICQPFNIEYDYIIDDVINGNRYSEVLELDGQKITCSMNSISATIEEVIGYIFVTYYCNQRDWHFKPQTKKYIKQYWIN